MKRINRYALLGMLLVTSLGFTTLTAKPKLDAETRQEMMQLKAEQARASTQERLLKLKTALELRDDQMSAWNDYESFLLNEQSQRQAMMKQMHERRLNNLPPPSSLELAQKNVERLERQLANARSRLVVFTDLYNVLDEQQQQTVDRVAQRKVKRMANKLRKAKKADKDDQ